MVKPSKEPLKRYVRRIMKQKGFTLREIELRSHGEITDGYVADILRGTAKNPSAEKIKALALGLGVDAHALFDVICGPFEKRKAEEPPEVTSDAVFFLEVMQEVAESPELVKIVEEAIQLWPEERGAVLESLESLNWRKQRPQRSKKSPLGRK